MNVELRFDYYSRIVFIPDCYVDNMEKLQNDFFEWMKNQPECIVISPGNQLAYSYNENDFINYLNSVVLYNHKEKAYLLESKKSNKDIKHVFMF